MDTTEQHSKSDILRMLGDKEIWGVCVCARARTHAHALKVVGMG